MTLIDKLIPYYVRFIFGFGFISVFIGMISFGMNIVTMITVKGFYIPAWLIPITVIIIVLGCTAVGYYAEKKNVLNRITSHSNKNTNPELSEIVKDIKTIKKMMEEHIG